MFCYFELNFIEIEFIWESGFYNFGHVAIFAKRKLVFWQPFWYGTFCGWVQVGTPLCTNGSKK